MASNKWDIGLGLSLKKDALNNIQNQIDKIGQEHTIKLTIDSSDVKKQLNDIQKQIQSLSNVKINLASNSANIKTPKIIDGSDTRYIYTVTEAYKELMNAISQVRSNKEKLATLDIKTNPEQIKVLKEQIVSLEAEAEKLWATWSDKFTLVQTNNINRAWDNEFRSLSKISAQQVDKNALKENEAAVKENANAYKQLLDIQNKISSKQISIAKLDPEKNAFEIESITIQIEKLETEYNNLRKQLSGKLTIGQLQELDNVSKQTASDIEIIKAKWLDVEAKMETSQQNKEVISGYKQLLDLQNQISNKQISVAKLDPEKDANAIATITAQIRELESAYSELSQQMSGKLSSSQLQELDSVSKQTASDIEIIKAKLSDLNTAQSNKANATELKSQFRSLLDIANEMADLNSKINKLGFSGNNTNQIKVLQTQLNNLIHTYINLKTEFESNGGIDVVGESTFKQLDNIITNTNNRLKVFQATYADTRAKMATSIQANLSVDETGVVKLISQFNALNIEESNVTENLQQLKTLLSQIKNSDNVEAVIADYEQFKRVLTETKSKVNQMQIELSGTNSASKLRADKSALGQDIELWLKRNSAASDELKNKMKELKAQIHSADRTKLNALKGQFSAISKEAKIAGDNALTFGDRLKAQISKLGIYFSGIMIITRAIQVTKQAVQTVMELDTALIDLKKTTTATDEELQKFYFDANETGKKLGVTTQDVIQAAAEWSRLGYNIKEAQTMAETSSIFASISPNVDIEKATDGLVSAMKAYKIEADDALDGVASKINAIGNTQAVANADIIEFLTRSSSAMAVANNTLDETIALGTAITEVTRDAANAGQVMKTASMRIRGYDEETEQLSKDVQVLVGDIANLTKTAEHPIGVSIFSDEAKTQYKSTVEILREISKVWDELTDKQQARVLEALGGKRGGQALAAAIENFDAVEKSLNTMQNSAGNAMQEMSVIEESLEYKLNKLKQTGVGVAQNVFSQDAISGWITVATKALEVIDGLTKSVGGLGTAFTALMAYKGFKGTGIFNLSDMWKSGNIQAGFTNVKNYFTQRQLTDTAIGLGLTQDSINRLTKFDALMADGATRTQALKQTMLGASRATKEAAISISNGSVQLNELATASKAAQLGMNLLNSALNIGVSIAISLAIKGIYSAIHAAEEAYKTAKEQAEESRQALENTKSQNQQIEELISKYKELRENENGNSVETRSKLLDLQEEITNLVGHEADNVDLVNGKLQEQLDILNDISDVDYNKVVLAAENALRDARNETSKFQLKTYKNGIAMPYNIGVEDNDIRGRNIVESIMRERGIGTIHQSSGNVSAPISVLQFNEGTTWTARLDAINAAIDALKASADFDTSEANGIYDNLIEARNEINKVVEQERKTAYEYISVMAQQQTKQNKDTINSYYDFVEARRKIIDDISNDGTVKMALADSVLSKEDIEKSVNDYMSTFDNLSDYYDEWIRRNTLTSTDAEKAWDAQQKQLQDSIVETYKSAYDGAKKELNKEPTLTLFNSEEYKDKAKEVSQIITDLENGIKAIDNGDVPEPELFTKLPELAGYAEDTDALRQAMLNLMTETPNDLIDELTKLKDKIDLSAESIKNALDELSLGGKVNLTNRPVIDTQLLKDAGWDDIEGDIATVYSSTYTNGETGKKAIAINFTPIVVDKNGNYVGVLSPDELDEYAESVIAGTRADDLHLQIGAEFNGKNAEKEATATAEYIHQLQEYIYSYSSEELTEEENKQKAQVQGFITLLEKMTGKVKELNGALTNVTASDYIKYEEDNIQKIIDKLEKEKDAQNDILDSLKEQKEELESIISDYEKTADIVGKYIDRTQIKPLENRKTEIEEYYNTEIDKLKEENEERNRNIELQEKQDALTNARKTKVKVYSETQGWITTEDKTAIHKAENELKDLKNEFAIEDLEKQRDAEVKGIEDQIKTWENYKDKWKEQVDAITEADEELIASKVLGVEWHESVSNQDIDIMTNYGAEYAAYNNQLKNQVNVEINNLERVIKSREKEITDWKNYKQQVSDLNKDITNSNSEYLENLNQFFINENSSWEERIKHMKRNAEIIAELNDQANSINVNEDDDSNDNSADNQKKDKKGNVVYAVTRNGEVIQSYATAETARQAKERLVQDALAKQLNAPGMPSNVMETLKQKIMSSFKIERIEKFATGGISSNTGLAWLDGTQNNSEVIFNAQQAKKLFDLVNDGRFADSIKNNILKEFKNPLNRHNANSMSKSVSNEITISFPNANINAKDYNTFKDYMDRYTNDLMLKMQVGL